MRVALFGYLGGMGRRYQAILRSLEHDFVGIDLNGVFGPCTPQSCDAVIIASSTNSHVDLLRHVKDWKKPVLCEKPITKDMKELEDLIWDLKRSGTRVQMVNNYDYMPLCGVSDGETVYDNWNSGRDGLAWDCIQLIALARGKITLSNESPVWKCYLNGNKLDIRDIDRSYVCMVARWLMDPQCHYERILESHAKVHAYLEAQCRAF